MARIDKTGLREKAPGVWEVRVHVGHDPVTGKIRQVSRTSRGGVTAAQKARAKLLTEVKAGKYGGTTSTLGALLDEWQRQKDADGARRTLAEEQRKIDKDIRPAIGHIPLAKLTAHDLDNFYRSQLDGGKSRQTVLHLHRMIHAALSRGVDWGWVEANVAKRAKPPKPERPDSTIPEAPAVLTLIDEARRSRNPVLGEILHVAALTGMRAGELCGLTFSAVDLEANVIDVRQSVWQVGGEWGVKRPKSGQGRQFSVAPAVTHIVSERARLLAENAALTEVPIPGEAFVWSRDELGQIPYTPSSISQAFWRLKARLGLKVRLHDLRGYAGSELIARGIDPRTAADMLGHADPSTTLRIYTRGRPRGQLAAAEALAESLLTPDEGGA